MNKMTPDICKAIEKRIVLQFMYKGEKRVIEPFTYGYYESTGNYLLSGYQVDGYSLSGKRPAWRTYDLDQVYDLKYTREKARSHRRGYNSESTKMSRVFCKC